MRKFLKESSMFYGVLIFMSLIIFSNPSRLGKITEAQRSSLMGVYGYFAMVILAFTVAFLIRSYSITRVKFGMLKSIDDGRYINVASKSDVLYILAAIVAVIAIVVEVPKLVKAAGGGFFTVLLGKSPIGYTLLGVLLAFIICLYAVAGYRMQELDLPRKRRGKAHVQVALTDFLSSFVAHVPTLVSVGVMVYYLVTLHGMK